MYFFSCLEECFSDLNVPTNYIGELVKLQLPTCRSGVGPATEFPSRSQLVDGSDAGSHTAFFNQCSSSGPQNTECVQWLSSQGWYVTRIILETKERHWIPTCSGSALGLGLNSFEEPCLRKADSKKAAKEKVGSVSEQISFVEKTQPLWI